MNEIQDVLLKATVDMLKDENKRLVDLNDLWRERFEEADKEILKVGVSMWIIGIFMGAVIGNAIIGWLT